MNYEMTDSIAVLHLDDGKANVFGHTMLDFINESLDQAEADDAGAVILRGRDGMFSAGFDLKEFQKGAEAGVAMVQRGFRMLVRLYGLERPLLAACSGHGIALGAFVLFACDNRVGVDGEFKFSLPETAISMDLPGILRELAVARLNPQYLTRVAIQSENFAPAEAVTAGFLDEVVSADELDATVMAHATRLAALPREYYAKNKLSFRQPTLDRMQASIDKLIAGGA